MAAFSVIFSMRMIKKQFMKKYAQPVLPYFKKYIFVLLISIVFISAASGIEAFLSPWLMKMLITSANLK
jgi:stage II sporulation protein M